MREKGTNCGAVVVGFHQVVPHRASTCVLAAVVCRAENASLLDYDVLTNDVRLSGDQFRLCRRGAAQVRFLSPADSGFNQETGNTA